MSQQYSSSFRNCATCAYWTGLRETDNFGQRVCVDSSMSVGGCMCRESGWSNSKRQANASCSHYEKWAPLK